MANQEHVDLLKSGVDIWNQWRKENPDIIPNFQEANLSGLNLAGANLSKANLTDANLEGANLRGANLTDANLAGVDLSKANLRWANLSGANLSGANFPSGMTRRDLPSEMPRTNLPSEMPRTNLPSEMPRTNLPSKMDSAIPSEMPRRNLPRTGLDQAATEAKEAEKDNNVSFSAYYTPKIQANKKSNLLVFVYIPENVEQIKEIAGKFFEKQGETAIDNRESRKTANIKYDTPISVSLECKDIEFDPFSITKKWKGEHLVFEFSFTPVKAEKLTIHAIIQAYGIEIASVENCVIDVYESSDLPIPENMYARAKTKASEGYLKESIFVSYSRKDKLVVENYRLAQDAIGNDIFIDVHSIRAGQSWEAEIAKAIDRADIFQLFWSKSSESSKFVRYEWEYALKYKCQETNCIGFIRPVFWQKELPVNPPKELGHLHFKFVPFGKWALED